MIFDNGWLTKNSVTGILKSSFCKAALALTAATEFPPSSKKLYLQKLQQIIFIDEVHQEHVATFTNQM